MFWMEDYEQILQQIVYLCDKRKYFYRIMSSNSAYLSNIQNNNINVRGAGGGGNQGESGR